MADETRRPPEGMLIVEWSGAGMMSSAPGRLHGAEAWAVLRRMATRFESGPGLVRTDSTGLVSGVQSLVDGPAAGTTPGSWEFAGEAPEPEPLRLQSPEAEVAAEAPKTRATRSLFGTRAAAPVTPPATRRTAKAPAARPAEAPRAPATSREDTAAPAVEPRSEPVRPDPAPRGTLVRPAGTAARRPAVRKGNAPHPVTLSGAAPTSPSPAPSTTPTRETRAARPMPGASGDLMTALRLRSAPATGDGTAPAEPARPTGLLASMDLPALAAAGEPAVPAVRVLPEADVERTVLAPSAPVPEAAPAPVTAATNARSAKARMARSSAVAPRPTGSTPATPTRPVPAGTVAVAAPTPSFGPTPLSRGTPRTPSTSRPTRGAGMATAWTPVPPAPSVDPMLGSLGPALSRLTAVADGPRADRPDVPAAPEGVLADAAYLDLAPAAREDGTGPAAVAIATPRTRPGTPAPRRTPATEAPRPAEAQRTTPTAPPRTAAPATHPAPSTGRYAPRPATTVPGTAAEAAPTVAARTPLAAGSLTLSVPSPMAQPGLASGRPFARTEAAGPAAPDRPPLRSLAAWIASAPATDGKGLAGTPRSGILDLGDEDRALLQVSSSRTEPAAGQPGRRAPSRHDRARQGPVPVLPERSSPRPPVAAAPTTPGPATPVPAGAQPAARPETRAAAPTFRVTTAPASGRPAPASGRDLSASVLAPMGGALAGATSIGALRGTLQAVDPYSDADQPAPTMLDSAWSLPGDDAALLALPATAPAEAPASPTAPAPGRASRRAASATKAAKVAEAARPAVAPAAAPAPIVTAATVSRRAAPMASVARAGVQAADRPMSRTGLGNRPAVSRRPAPPRPATPGGFDAPADLALVARPVGGRPESDESPTARFVPGAAAPAAVRAERFAPLAGASPLSTVVASGTAPGAVPPSLDLPVPEGFDLVALKSPVVPAFERGALAPAAGSAESLASLRRTLVRSLGALAPASPGSASRPASPGAPAGIPLAAADAGTTDLVEWIRLLGGGRSATPPSDAPPSTSRASAGSPALPGSTGFGEAPAERTFVDVDPGRPSGPVHPEAVRGSLPGLPEPPAAAARFDVSLPDRGFVSPGGIASAFAGLGASPSLAAAGPTYHGTLPLVSTAVSAVAATALAATKGEEAQAPAAAPDAAGKQGQENTAVDLEGLAAEMAERILRRLKRDKERRGFYG